MRWIKRLFMRALAALRRTRSEPIVYKHRNDDR